MSDDLGAVNSFGGTESLPFLEAQFQQEIPIKYQNQLPDSGYATGIAFVPTSDGQFQMRLAVSGDVEVVRNFENAKFLQLSFQPISKDKFEEILKTLPPKLDDTIVPNIQQHFEELATFAKQASPEQLVRLERVWQQITAGGDEQSFWQWLDRGDDDKRFGSFIRPKFRTIRILQPENFEGYARLQFVLDPELTEAHPTDIYVPNVTGGYVKASVTVGFLRLYGKKKNVEHTLLHDTTNNPIVTDVVENNLSLEVSAGNQSLPLTYDLTKDTFGLWK